MEDLLRLLPRRIVLLVVVPFFVGVAGLLLLVRMTPAVQAFLYLLFVGGIIVLVLGAVGMTLLVKQSRGLDRHREADE